MHSPFELQKRYPIHGSDWSVGMSVVDGFTEGDNDPEGTFESEGEDVGDCDGRGLSVGTTGAVLLGATDNDGALDVDGDSEGFPDVGDADGLYDGMELNDGRGDGAKLGSSEGTLLTEGAVEGLGEVDGKAEKSAPWPPLPAIPAHTSGSLEHFTSFFACNRRPRSPRRRASVPPAESRKTSRGANTFIAALLVELYKGRRCNTA